jgi:type IV pilus assembly protein PilB
VQDEIRRLVGGKVQAVLATPSNIREALSLKANLADAFGIQDIVDSGGADAVELIDRHDGDASDLSSLEFEEQGGLSPVVRLVNFLIARAVQDGASDIHIESDEDRLRVRFRVDGVLAESFTPPRSLHSALVSRIKVMAHLDISERRLPQDGRIRVVLNRRPIDLRVSTLPCQHGEKVVIRILDKDSMLFDLEAIGMHKDLLARLDREIRRPNGLVLVTGPTGSGKSTTLYSALLRIDSKEQNVCTVENPIEFSIRGINQVQTNEKIGMSFATVLRSLLRQDPDVIMVGEIRDRETATMAVQASLTGHLVFSTLHTNDAPSAVTRLSNMEIEPYLLGACLNAVVAQRLVRRLCQECRERWNPDDPSKPARGAKERLKSRGFDVENLFVGRGCSQCRNTGYMGRIGLFELFTLNDELRDLVVAQAPLQAIRKAARDHGMKTLLDDGIAKAREGITSAEEVLRVTD